MGELFTEKAIKPMLIGAEDDAFNSPDYLYELKLDGIRCIAYLDGNGIKLWNKRNINLLLKVPELLETHQQIKADAFWTENWQLSRVANWISPSFKGNGDNILLDFYARSCYY